MQIQWLGHSYFKIQTKNNLGQEVTIAIDPFDEAVGLKVSKFEADIVAVTHDHHDHNNVEAIKGSPFIINGPGEYETKGVFIYGIPAWHDDQNGKKSGPITIYKINSENINLVHLGDLGHMLSDEQIEKLGDVDVLMIPVGGIYTIDAKKANEIVSEIEPRLVVPMHYKTPGNKTNLDGVDGFLKVSGLTNETVDKLKISKKDLPQEQTKVIILNP